MNTTLLIVVFVGLLCAASAQLATVTTLANLIVGTVITDVTTALACAQALILVPVATLLPALLGLASGGVPAVTAFANLLVGAVIADVATALTCAQAIVVVPLAPLLPVVLALVTSLL